MKNTTRHYNPQPSIPSRYAAAVAAAYTAADLEPPTFTLAIDDAIAAEPTPEQVAEAIALEHQNATDPAAFLEAAVDRIRRAAAVHELRMAISKYREKAAKSVHAHHIAQAAVDLAPAFDAAVATLTKAAKKLPADPFDIDAVVAADATREMKDAADALKRLGTFASIHVARSSSAIEARARVSLYVVDVDDVPTEEVNRMSGNPHPGQDHEGRGAIRRFLLACGEDIDAALVGVAAGTYGDHVRFSFAESIHDVAARIHRAENAVRRIRTDGPEPARSGARPMRINVA